MELFKKRTFNGTTLGTVLHYQSLMSLIRIGRSRKTIQNDTTMTTAVKTLGTNPLPAIIEITPNQLNNTPQAIETLYNQLKTNPNIASAQLNLTWVKRLFYVLETLKHLTLAIAILFSAGLILIVGNTIRLSMKSHERDIYILRLIGATNAFIRRPLLYRGLLYGIGGGIIAWLLCTIILWWLQGPASQLALTYHNSMTLHGLSFKQGMLVVLSGGILSYLGARATANHCLRQKGDF